MTAGNRVFWPNRKSKHGMQSSSKVPRMHQRPWSTTPPIAEDPMLDLKTFGLTELDAAKAEVERLREENAELLSIQTSYDELMKLKAGLLVSSEKQRVMLAEARVALDDALAAERAARKANDPETIALKVMYGVDEAMKEHARELAALKSLLGERDSEIAELKRSKKRLREALERLSRST